jgi:GMP synthase PP-ATPase subunit
MRVPRLTVLFRDLFGICESYPYLSIYICIYVRFHGILVDHGLMRKEEGLKVHKRLVGKLHLDLKLVDASEIFFSRLQDVS